MDQVEEKKPEPGKATVEHVNLVGFERLVYGRDVDRAAIELLMMLRKLRGMGGFAFEPERQFTDPVLREKLYTRFAAAISALFADAGMRITETGFRAFAILNPILSAVFAASTLDNSDHVIRLLTSKPEETDAEKFTFDDDAIFAKAMSVWCMNSTLKVHFEEAFEKAPNFFFPLWLSMISYAAVLDDRAFENREALLGMGKFFSQAKFDMELLTPLADAYMHCSYAVRPDKHEVKRILGRAAYRLIAGKIGAGTVDSLSVKAAGRRPLGGTEKPVILFPLEAWTSFHAMYRVYAPVVEQLRERFRCVAYLRPTNVDQIARDSFDEVIELPGKDTVMLDAVVKNTKALKPDVVYYLSSGMALWWVAIAQMRLAPIQMLSLGHPATTMSPAMDYALVEEGLAPDAEVFSERILELPPNALRFVNRADTEEGLFTKMRKRHLARPRSNVVKVAVPAMVAKLSVPFLQSLRRVAERAAEKQIAVEYHFFPNHLGLGHAATERQLRARFPGCVVRPRTGYVEYLAWLADCDLHASPFPFGGTNSNVDSLALGLPIIALEGPREPHERYDAAMLRRLGLHHMIAADVQGYEELLYLAMTVVPNTLDYDVEHADLGAFFRPLEAPAAGAFARAIEYVYREHPRIRQLPKGKRVRWQDYTP